MTQPLPTLGPLAASIVRRFGHRLAMLGLRLESARSDPSSFGDEYARFSDDRLHIQAVKDRGVPVIELQPREGAGTADAVDLIGLLGVLRTPPADDESAGGVFADVLELIETRRTALLDLLGDWPNRKEDAWTARARLSGSGEVFERVGATTYRSVTGVEIDGQRPFAMRYSEPGRSTMVGFEYLVNGPAAIVVYVSGVRAWIEPPAPASDHDRLRIGRNVLAALGAVATLG